MSGNGAWRHLQPERDRSVEWYTPPEIFVALGIDFDLDPCQPISGRLPWIPARNIYTANDDGLRQPWAGRVWLNPPYGRHVGRWTDKLLRHGNGIALVFARTDTPWCQRAMATAHATCFIAGRIRFIDRTLERSDRTASPSVLLAYGDECEEAITRSGLGIVVHRIGNPPSPQERPPH